MALTSSTSIISPKSSFISTQPSLPGRRPVVVAVHAAEPAKNQAVSTAKTTVSPAPSTVTTSRKNAAPSKWGLESWKSKKALQLPEYPNKEDLEMVLRTLDSFPPIVFAGEARSLEERLAEASTGNANPQRSRTHRGAKKLNFKGLIKMKKKKTKEKKKKKK